MPKYLIIAYHKEDIKSSIITKFAMDDEEKENMIDRLMETGYRASVYEWYVPLDDSELPYYKIRCVCFHLGF